AGAGDDRLPVRRLRRPQGDHRPRGRAARGRGGRARQGGGRQPGDPLAPHPLPAQVLPRLRPQLGVGDHPAHRVHQGGDLLPDAEVAAVGQEDAEAGAQDERHPQEVRERPAEAVGRDDEPLQGARRLAVRRLSAELDPDADLDRALLDAELRRRALSGTVPAHPRPDCQGPVPPRAAAAAADPALDGRGDVRADADVPLRRRSAAAEDDVRDDAGHVHGLLPVPAGRPGDLHADQLPHRDPAAALGEPPRPQGDGHRLARANLIKRRATDGASVEGGSMKFFIDGADPKEIRTCVEQGLIDGVTTNPTLISKVIAAGSEAREPRALLKEICDICKGPISAEVVSEDKDGMMREAREYVKIAPNIVGKLPLTTEGLKAVRACADEKIMTIYKNYGFKTEVLVASVRGPNHIVEAALVGADVATVPFAVLQTLVKHPLTDSGLAKFLADWKKVQK